MSDTYLVKLTIPVEIELRVHADEDEDAISALSVFEAQAALRNRVKVMGANDVQKAVDAALDSDDYAITNLSERDEGNAQEDAWDRAEASRE